MPVDAGVGADIVDAEARVAEIGSMASLILHGADDEAPSQSGNASETPSLRNTIPRDRDAENVARVEGAAAVHIVDLLEPVGQ